MQGGPKGRDVRDRQVERVETHVVMNAGGLPSLKNLITCPWEHCNSHNFRDQS